MEKHGEWGQLNGFHPNGLLVKGAGSVTRELDPKRWDVAEERVAELISQIQPNWTSEKHRNAVASYVQRLIANCVPCQVFTFGSVPLKTYLPDGDIDLTAFSDEHNLKDDWANIVLDMLRREENNEFAEFQVQEVQYIQAEVKIIKCLVDNIVVDISFNQLGGLCTLCFLEEVDFRISQNHLFKRSVILIKAWCYYESRILGAHHGLISTYALEILVLYIFHVFNNSFAGPLEVLYRFVEFFSKFDWANFCVSLWGPVPIRSLPNITADPPRKDGAELLLDKMFLGACKTVYSVFPGVQHSQEQPFMSKYFNVVDPLRTNNNLGRSVSKGNFYRIRSAFSFGAQQLARILECPEENIVAEVNQFFVNTWNRHGKGYRPDGPVLDALYVKKINAKDDGNRRKNKVENLTENVASQYPKPDKPQCYIDFPMQPGISPVNQIDGTIAVHKDSRSPRERDHEEVSRTHWGGQYYTQRKNSIKNQQNEIDKISKENLLQNRGHARPQFARTSSSPELTSMPSKTGSLHKHNSAVERVKEFSHSRSECNRRSRGSEVEENHDCIADELHSRESSSRLNHYTSVSSHTFVSSPVSISAKPVVSSAIEPSQRHEGAQNFTNVVSSSGVHNYGGHVPMPVNLPSHQYVSIPTFLPGYRPQKYGGKLPSNLTAFQSNWSDVMQYPSGSQEVDHLDDEPDSWTDSNGDSVREIDDGYGEVSTSSSRLSPAFPNSFRTKASSESSWDGKASKVKNPIRYPVAKQSSSSMNPVETVDSPWLDGGPADQSYDDVNDKSDATSVTSSHGEVHHLPGFGQSHMGYTNSVLPFAPMFVRPGSHQGVNHSHAVPVALYPAGPMPFVTMVPLYNVNAERGKSVAPTSNDHMEVEKPTFSLSQSSQSLDPAKGLKHSNHSNINGSMKRTSSAEHSEAGLDIFSSDFPSHWKNLQYGRHCQTSQLQHPFIYSPSSLIPPSLPQGNIPSGSPRSPHPENSNVFTHVVPVSAQPPGPPKPAGVSRQYDGEYTKHRNGTGTYFPNPKVLRDHQLSTSRQNQGDSRHAHDRNDQHREREGNWNFSSRPRFAGRAQPRYRYDKPNSKIDRSVASGSQTDRHGDTFRKKPHQFHRFPRDASTSKPTWNVHYDANHPVYQTHSRYYHNEVSQSGDSFPPLVMLYPYPQTIAYGAQIEPMQFGSVGPHHFVGLEEVQGLNSYPKGGNLELQNYQGDTGPPSPDYASPPRFPRDDGD